MPIVIVVTDERELANGATQQASSVVVKSQEAHTLVQVLRKLLPGVVRITGKSLLDHITHRLCLDSVQRL